MTGVEEQVAQLLKSSAPACQAVSFDDVRRRVRQRRTIRLAATGSALSVIAVAAAAGLLVSTGGGEPAEPATSPSVNLTGAVPWIDSPAQPYQPPAASATKPAATDARPCTARDVAARFEGHEGAGGHSVNYVRFRNVSSSTCVLKGYPTVTASEPGQPDVQGTNGSFFPSPGTADMAPDGETILGLGTDTYCDKRPGGGVGGPAYHHVAVGLPGGGTVELATPSGGLDVTCGLHLMQFFVPPPTETGAVDPLGSLTAVLETPERVRAGSTLVYVAALTNPTDNSIRLDPCPSYVQSTAAPTPVKDGHQLNCKAMPTIAGGQTVRFEMRMTVPAGAPKGPLTIYWSGGWPNGVSATASVDVT